MPIHSSLNSLFHLLFIHLFFRKSIHSFVRSSVESSSPFIHWLSDWVSEWVRGCLNASFIHSFVPFFIFSLTCSLWFFPIWPGTKNRGRLRCPWLEEKGWGGGRLGGWGDEGWWRARYRSHPQEPAKNEETKQRLLYLLVIFFRVHDSSHKMWDIGVINI